MSLKTDATTLVCLFHHQDHARDAINDLRQAGIPESAVSVIGGPGTPADALEKSELASLGMPDKDYDHLKQGIRNGGLVLAVSALERKTDSVEAIFKKHSAKQIDEAQTTGAKLATVASPVAAPVMADVADGQQLIPVIEEELVIGKRTVDQGGVRVYRRVVEIPVEQSVTLQEDHVVLERKQVNRAVSDQDMPFQDRSIELTETAEEAVVSKNARVVEELLVGKSTSQHVETIQDTVRKTEVDVEDIPAARTTDPQRR